MTKVGLVDAHAYSLLAAVDVEIGLLKREKLILIRNPWGFREWGGDWGDDSNKWKEFPDAAKNIRKILSARGQDVSLLGGDQRDPNDGCFWMTVKDYVRFFYITSICYYKPTWENSWIQDMHSLPTALAPKATYSVFRFAMAADVESDCMLTINQINARHMDETMRGSYQYAPIRAVVAKIEQRDGKKPGEDPKDLVFIEGDYFDGCSTVLRFPQMARGEYLLYCKVEWTNLHPVRKIVISLYAPG